MPSYEYACSNCNALWSEDHKIDDRNKPIDLPCPTCSTIGSVTKELGGQLLYNSTGSLGTVPQDFKDLVKNIQTRNRGHKNIL